MNNSSKSKYITELSPEKLERFLQQVSSKKKKEVMPTQIQRCSRDSQIFPLSFAQQRLWFLDQLLPNNPLYNCFAAVRLIGTLNVSALEKSLNEIIKRHETLRTTFTILNEQPVQIVAPSLSLTLPVLNLRYIGVTQRETQALQLAIEEAQRPFDLTQGPLIRSILLQLDEQEYVLLLSTHHIISDGWSVGVLIQEITTFYSAFCTANPLPLPELPINYVDFVHWQQQRLQGEFLDTQISYWKQQLANAPTVLDLPTDHPRPAIQTYQGSTLSFVISSSLTKSLKILSHEEGTTLFMTLLAAFKILLYRYTASEDIVVGSPVAYRNRSEIEKLIGFFVNTLVFRTSLSGNPNFCELLSRVKEMALGAYAHQDLPFEKLVEALQLERNLTRTPLFQVMCVMQNAPIPALDIPGLTLSLFPVEMGTAKFDLTLEVVETLAQLNCRFEYNKDLFDTSTISRMVSNFQTLLAGIVANPKQLLSDLPLLTPAEERQLLIEWDSKQLNYSQDACIHQLFEIQVERSPNAVAVVFEGKQLSYLELNQRANQLAQYLQSLGVGPEVAVGICVERSLEMIVGLLAILKAGGAYVPLDPDYPQQRLAFIIQDSQLSVLLTQQKHLPRLTNHLANIVCLDTDWQTITQYTQENPVSKVTAENLCYIIYTSGSTGNPKGVQVLHNGVVNCLKAMGQVLNFTKQDILPAITTICFDIAAIELYLPLTVGSHIVLVSREITTDATQFLQVLEKSGATLMQATPATWRMLLAAGWQGNQQLKIISGGEAISRDLANQLLTRSSSVWNVYGPTETTIWSTYDQIEPGNTFVSIGRPLANTQIYVLDNHLKPVPIGVRGELYIGGSNLARGYWNRFELTAEKFIPHPFSNEPGLRLYKTGDLVRYLPNGNIEYLGRGDHQVKIRGYRIELVEIEAVLSQHPDVLASVAITWKDEAKGNQLVAYVVPKIQSELSSSRLHSYLKEHLPIYMVPSAFIILEALPLTPNGKLDRGALPSPEMAYSQLSTTFVAPRTPIEEILANIWSEVLGVEQVGVYDSFFELGGDSILSTQIIAKANQAQLRLTLKQIFQHQTIAELANVANTTLLIQAEQGVVIGSLPLTPIQQWFFQQNLPEPYHWNQAVLLEVLPNIDVAIFKQVSQHLLVHHDALRLNFFHSNSTDWQQFNSAPQDTVFFSQIDLSALSEAEQRPAIAEVAAELQTSFCLSETPLIRFVFFDLGANKFSRLLIIIHHLVVDNVSWRILLEDLQTGYKQFSQEQIIQLPPKTTSFKNWSERIAEYAQSYTFESERAYWLGDSWVNVPCIPVDYSRDANIEASACTVTVSLDVEETRILLQEVPKAYNTQINDVLLTALVQIFMEWTGSSSILLDLEGHGREDIFADIDLSRTVGWFTTIFPVLFQLQATDNLGNALKSIKEQLRCIPNRGIGYGLLRYLSDNKEIAAKLHELSQPEIIFNYLGQFDRVLHTSSLFKPASESCGILRNPQGRRSHLLEINGYVAGGQLRLDWTYSNNVHQKMTIENLMQKFLQALQALITHCLSPEAGGHTPSDFPEANLSQEKLDDLIAELSIVEDYE